MEFVTLLRVHLNYSFELSYEFDNFLLLSNLPYTRVDAEFFDPFLSMNVLNRLFAKHHFGFNRTLY